MSPAMRPLSVIPRMVHVQKRIGGTTIVSLAVRFMCQGSPPVALAPPITSSP